MKHILILLALLNFVACNVDIDGKTVVKKEMLLKTAKSKIKLSPGEYLTKVKLSLTNDPTFSFYRNYKDHAIVLGKPDKEIPEDDYFTYKYLASENGTDFDILIEMQRKTTKSDDRKRYHICNDNKLKVETITFHSILKTNYFTMKFVDPKTQLEYAAFEGISYDDSEKDGKSSGCK